MPKLTREQYNKWNAAALHGFEFDIMAYIRDGSKELIKASEIITDATGEHKTEYTLLYLDEYERKTNHYGVSYNVTTGRHIPALHIAQWHRPDPSRLWTSHGIGKYIHIGEPQKTKNYSVLCKLSGTIDLDTLPPYDEIETAIRPSGLIIE